MNMKIEWVLNDDLYDQDVWDPSIPVVRLDAVDQVIGEAVKFAEEITALMGQGCKFLVYVEARAFLNSHLVAEWRKWQEEGKS